MIEHKRSTRDTHEIHQEEHDEALNARRVTVVGNAKLDLDIDTRKVTNALTEAMSGVKFEGNRSHVDRIEVIEIPTQVFVPQVETKIIEVPVVVKEVQVIEVEKPVITEVLKIVEVEKPVTIQNNVYKTPAWAWSLIITQTAVLIGGAAYALYKLGVINV